MSRRDNEIASRLATSLNEFDQTIVPLMGIENPIAKQVFIEQVLESLHRVWYVSLIKEREISAIRLSPIHDGFDPIKGAILCLRDNNVEEAIWLVFLSVVFGRHKEDGWKLCRNIYGRLGEPNYWTWAYIRENLNEFFDWLAERQKELVVSPNRARFGNHRKYETLDVNKHNNVGYVIGSYVEMMAESDQQREFFQRALTISNFDPCETFNDLYQRLSAVARFGRMARFDFLCMIGKLGIFKIEPGTPYLKNSTGPLRGAKLLVYGNGEVHVLIDDLDQLMAQLARALKVGMQALEDALCNWQKSPTQLVRFRG